MAADLISEIVSQEALDQVSKLTLLLKEATSQMDNTIAAAAEVNKSLTGNSTKTANDALNNYNTTQQKLIETESERLNIERQIKIEGEKMAANVKVTSNAIEQAAAKYKLFSNSQKELAQYIVETDRRLAEIKETLKNADTNASNYAEATARLKVEQARLKAELSESTKELKRTVTEQKYADDSMKGMSVRLQQLRDLYAMFTTEERNSDFGMTISAGINELDEKLKGLDKSIGENQRNVGNYEIAGKSLRMELREIVQELANQKMRMDEAKTAISQQEAVVKKLANTVGTNSDEYKEAKMRLDSMTMGLKSAAAAMTEMEKRGGEIKDAMDDANKSIKGMADDAGNTAAMSEGVGVLANSFQVFQAGMAAVGLEGEDMMKVYAKMMILQQGFNSLTQITNALQSESILRLKLKAIWDKTVLVFTQKKTAATIAETAAETTNTAVTAAAATATTGLAAAEGVATKTSWTLVGSLKAVGVAIKSIPVVGWILAAVAALGTLTVLLYKHISAEKEMTAEQKTRLALQKSITEINQKTNESTLENITRVKLLQKELGKVKQGSKDYQSIVEEINTITGSQFDKIKATPKEIEKGTAAWIQQYKIRAKAEATIQQMVESELEFERLRSEYFQSGTDPKRRKEIADQLKLDDKQIKNMLEITDLYKSNKKMSAEFKQNKYDEVKNIWEIAKQNLIDYNKGLENTITLDGLLTQEKDKQIKKEKEIKKEQVDQYKLDILTIELRKTGIEQENALYDLRLKKLNSDRIDALKNNPKDEINITRQYVLEYEKLWNEHAANIVAINKKISEDQTKATEERVELLDLVINKTYDYIDAINALAKATSKEQKEEKEKANQLLKDRISATGDMVIQFGELGKAIAQNVEDEKRRIKIEQRIAEVQVAINGAIAISQILIDKGDPYTKAVRIIANLAAVTTGIIAAENAIKQANSVSTYAEGTDYHKGGAAIVGEGGQPELLQVAGKTTWITEPTYFPNLPIGASVTPLSDMEQSKNMNDYWLEQIVSNTRQGTVHIDVSGNLLSRFRKDNRSLTFANRLFYINK